MTRLKFKHSPDDASEVEKKKGPLESEVDEALKDVQQDIPVEVVESAIEEESTATTSDEDTPMFRLKTGSFEETDEATDTSKIEKSEPETEVTSKVEGNSGELNLRLVNKEEGNGPSVGDRKKRVNKYFYKVSNHHELFKIGRSFHKDYMAGVKSFAITSTDYQSSQQNSILGLASFFDHKEDVKIAIISDNLYEGAFKDIVSICSKEKMDFLDQEVDATISSFYGHFDFIDLSVLLEISNDSSIEGYDEVFDQIVDLYDIVFWDVPELHKIQKDSEKYFPVIMKFESLSIIVAQSLTSSRHLEEVRLFFLGYGINLKGLLLDNKQAEIEEEEKKIKATERRSKARKKPWWRFF